MVTGTVDGWRLRRDINPGYSYLCVNEPIARFGLGDEAVLADVEIRWPDGRTRSIGDLAPGRIHDVEPLDLGG